MGLLCCWEKPKTKHQHYFESDHIIVANELINCSDDIQMQGIHKEENNTASVNLLILNEHDLQHLIQ